MNDFPSSESARDIGARLGPALRGPAFGRSGIAPRWISSSKGGVGTAFSPSSRVWLTLSHGILNEVYYPTLDQPQIRDLQFLVSDGETFFHEERRHLESRIECLEGDTLGYRVLSNDPEGRYRLVKEIIAETTTSAWTGSSTAPRTARSPSSARSTSYSIRSLPWDWPSATASMPPSPRSCSRSPCPMPSSARRSSASGGRGAVTSSTWRNMPMTTGCSTG